MKITGNSNLTGLEESLQRIGDRTARMSGDGSQLEAAGRGFLARAADGLRNVLSRLGIGSSSRSRQEAAVSAFETIVRARFSPSEVNEAMAELRTAGGKVTGSQMLESLEGLRRAQSRREFDVSHHAARFDVDHIHTPDPDDKAKAAAALREVGLGSRIEKGTPAYENFARDFKPVFHALVQGGEMQGRDMLSSSEYISALRLAAKITAALPEEGSARQSALEAVKGPQNEAQALGMELVRSEVRPSVLAEHLIACGRATSEAASKLGRLVEDSFGEPLSKAEAKQLRGALELRGIAEARTLVWVITHREEDQARFDSITNPDDSMRSRMASVLLGMGRARGELVRGGESQGKVDAGVPPLPLVRFFSEALARPDHARGGRPAGLC